MTPFPFSDLLIIAALLLLNGVFAMSELAIVSAKPSRLKAAAEQRHQPALTRDGHAVEVFANIGESAGIEQVIDLGAEGIELSRTAAGTAGFQLTAQHQQVLLETTDGLARVALFLQRLLGALASCVEPAVGAGAAGL